MAMLDWITPESGLRIDCGGVRLRAPRYRDYEAWAALRRGSRDFLQPWEPSWPPDDLERGAFRRRLAVYSREIDAGTSYPFFIHRRSDDVLVGGVTLSNIRRGVAQTATVGYWIGEQHARQGLMSAGLKGAVGFGFRTLGLHRLEAACLPQNEPSRQVLLKTGFKQEGFAPAYLKINGAWRDHLLFGIVDPASSI
jgi:ribosomal-protein-alanine N-acetyltransferase